MNLYLAPLEGVTGSIFRNCQHKCFGGFDKCFTPFISPNCKGALSTKVLRDILPENNEGQVLIPQILTNSAEGFLTMCKSLEKYGYTEFNLNLGCPSGTVVSKGRGAGFLAYPDELDRFLDGIMGRGYKISIKTRIGIENPDEFYTLLEIYNKYPLTELIIHPRTRRDMYNNHPDLEVYRYADENSKNKLCYNGDIFTLEDYNGFLRIFQKTDTIMLGRGVVRNPALPLILKNNYALTKDKMKEFYYMLYTEYERSFQGSIQFLYKMKEVLSYMVLSFEDSAKPAKKIKKAKNARELDAAVLELFSVCKLREH